MPPPIRWWSAPTVILCLASLVACGGEDGQGPSLTSETQQPTPTLAPAVQAQTSLTIARPDFRPALGNSVRVVGDRVEPIDEVCVSGGEVVPNDQGGRYFETFDVRDANDEEGSYGPSLHESASADFEEWQTTHRVGLNSIAVVHKIEEFGPGIHLIDSRRTRDDTECADDFIWFIVQSRFYEMRATLTFPDADSYQRYLQADISPQVLFRDVSDATVLAFSTAVQDAALSIDVVVSQSVAGPSSDFSSFEKALALPCSTSQLADCRALIHELTRALNQLPPWPETYEGIFSASHWGIFDFRTFELDLLFPM